MSPAPPPGRGPIRRLLATPDFRRIWLLGGIANTMRWLELLAATLWTFEATGSAFMVATVAMMRALPMLLLGAIAGALAERLDRRRLLIALQASSAIGAGLVALLAFTGLIAPWHLMVQGLLAGLAWAGEMATRRRMAADAAPPEDLVSAVALDTMTGSTTRAIGPLLGGALFQLIGLAPAAAIACTFHGLALFLAWRITPPRPVVRAPQSAFAGIVEAARFALAEPRLRMVLGVTLIMNVFAFCYAGILPAFGAAAFGASGAAIGLLAAAEPFGALLGGLWLALRGRRDGGGLAFVLGSLAFLITLLLAALSPFYLLAWGLLALGGLGTARFVTMQTALVMTSAPAEIRSRVLGLVTTCIGTGPAGVLALGALADALGPRAAMLIMGGIALLLLLPLLRRQLRR
jgi:MFS family permease